MRLTVTVAAACLSLLGIASANDARATIRQPTNIAAQELAPALKMLARDRNVQLVYRSDLLKDQRTSGAAGDLTFEEALKQLLKDTGLSYRYLDDDAITIVPIETPVGKNAPQASVDGRRGEDFTREAGDSNEGPRRLWSRFRLAQNSDAASARERKGGREGEGSNSSSSGQESAPSQEGMDAAKIDEVIVTASSRIRRAAEDIPAPTSVLDAVAISRTGFDNLSDVLTRTPQFGIGLGNNPGGGGANSSDAGATFLNLRGMGTNRTLVLIDGLRRVSGTASSSAVDLATIPAAMIDHVEVTTGGAAAVYGADAVTGVVNVILKHPTEGIDVAVRDGISGQGDASRPSIQAVFGQTTDRTEFSLGLSYSYEPLLHAMDRSFSEQSLSEFSNPNITADNPYTNLLFKDWRFPNTSYGSAFAIGGTRYTVDANGTVRPTQNSGGTPYGPLGFLAVGGDGFNIADFDVLRLQSRVFSSLANFGYRLSDSLKFTTSIQYGHSATDIPLQPNYEFWTIERDNPFLPAAVGTLMDQNGLTQLSYGRTDLDQGISHNLGERSTYTLVTKLDGDAGTRFKWDVSYQYGYFQGKSTLTVNRITSRYRQALDAVAGPSGPVCADPTAVAAGCVPINIFGPDAATPAAIAYFREDSVTNVTNSQQVMGAHLNGSLLELPAGPLMLAAGTEYRRESQDIQTDPLGVQRLLQVNNGPSSDTSFDVKEAFAEAVVPLLKDRSFAKVLELEAAGRYSDYNTIGSTTAWKFGGIWAPTDSVRLRFTRSSDVRAPTLTELFSPGINGLTNPMDPCAAININSGSSTRAANCAALGIPEGYVDSLPGSGKVLTTRGNPSLTEETSRDWTVGIVITPSVLPRLRISADWWRIEIQRAVTTLNAQRVVNGCVDGPTLSALLCPLVIRGGTVGGIPVSDLQLSGVLVQPVNAAKMKAEGIDFTAQYGFDLPTHLLGSSNSLTLALGGAYYLKNDTNVASLGPIHAAGNSSLPKIRANLTTEFEAGRLLLDWTTRYIGSSSEDVNYAPLFVDDNHVSSRLYNDIVGSVEINQAVRVMAGINNAFDVHPPATAFTFEGIGAGGLFDNIGRYFFVEARVRL